MGRLRNWKGPDALAEAFSNFSIVGYKFLVLLYIRESVKHLLHLIEEAARRRCILNLHRLSKLSEKILLVLIQLRRSLNPDFHNQVALPTLIKVWNSLASESELLATLRPLRNADRLETL